MPTYNIIMKQGITVRNLGNDTLVTGHEYPEDKLQSCSAILLFNSATRAAGLYHFPASDITQSPKAQRLIRDMAKAVLPDMAWITYGVATHEMRDLVQTALPGAPSDPFHDSLRHHVQGLLGSNTPVTLKEARTGVIALSQDNGVPKLSVEDPYTATDLRACTAGTYPNYTIYWADDGIAVPAPALNSTARRAPPCPCIIL
jgi:hypothetical protein